MYGRGVKALFFLAVLFVSLAASAASAPAGFQPVSAEELALKDVAAAPGAHAVILFRESTANDTDRVYTEHYRIKVLTEQGREYGNIEIPYSAEDTKITDIRARVVSPDGKSTDFNGEIREKVLVKSKKGSNVSAKTFALPNVDVGSIVEYRYTRNYTGNYVFPRMWDYQSALFTLRAHFSFVPYGGQLKGKYGKTGGLILPIGNFGAYVPQCFRGTCDLVAENIPPFVKEDYAPAELDLKSWVKFLYAGNEGIDSDGFWAFYSQHETATMNKFIGDRAAIKQEAERVTAASDSPSEKLRKIYQRAQQVRNTSFEPKKTAKEIQSEKPDSNVEDVLRKERGTGSEVNLLFVAMARALGFDAGIALLAPRSVVTFLPGLTDPSLFEASVVWVMVDGKLRYFDPATKYCPYDLLPWQEADASGIRLGGATAAGGTLVTTPPLTMADSLITRTGTLKLALDGSLSGTVQVTFERNEALSRRLAEWDSDELGRAESLEKELKADMPAGAVVKLQSLQHFEEPDQPLVAVFSIQLPGFAQIAGKRFIFPAELFSEPLNALFVPSKRTHPIDWRYPYQRNDDLLVQAPAGYEIEAVPDKAELSHFFGIHYSLTMERQSDGLRIRRMSQVKNYKFSPKQYAGLRAFVQKMRAADEQQIVFRGAKASVSAQ